MNFETYSNLSIILIFIGVMLMFLIRNWRWAIGALGLIYLGVFGLVALSWPSELALVKLITGWLSCSVLAVTQIIVSQSVKLKKQAPSELIFWALSAILIIIITTSISRTFGAWLPVIQDNQALAGLLLIGIGLLSLGFSNEEFRVTLSLLTLMAGFEILYSVVEASTLIAGLLAVVNLGIALSGAYLMVNPTMEDIE